MRKPALILLALGLGAGAQVVPRRALPALAQRAMLPTGMTITPVAAAGSFYVPLNPGLSDFPDFVAGQPVSTALSPDGTTLLVLTSGYNRMNDARGHRLAGDSREYIFVFDVRSGTPRKLQALEVPNAFDGIAWNPNGRAFYVSGGVDDNVHVFMLRGRTWAESLPPIALGHRRGLGYGVKPMAAGLAVTADGATLLVANFENDSLSVVDLRTRTRRGELDLRPGHGVAGGEFPFWVVAKGNGEAYVASPRDRQIVVVSLAGTPRVRKRIAVPGEPTKMILNRSQQRLYAVLPSDDQVAVIDTASNRVAATLATTAPRRVFANPHRLMGSNPNNLALSPNERYLYVTNGGANSIAVIALVARHFLLGSLPLVAWRAGFDPRQGPPAGAQGSSKLPPEAKPQFEGLIPTGWYPSAVSVSADGTRLYATNTRSVPGPNPGGCRDTTASVSGGCNGHNEYIWQLDKGGLEVIPVPRAAALQTLTQQAAANDHYVSDAQHAADEATMALLRQHIRHVIYIIKENRTYDQVLGDLPGGNGDPKLAILGGAISPNHHRLAMQFVDLDNFYCSGDVSGEGWNWSTAARASEIAEDEIPLYYAGRGLSYDFEGENRNLNVGIASPAARNAAHPKAAAHPNWLPGARDLDAPDGPGGDAGTGYLWNAAERAGLSLRNYGFFLAPSHAPLLRHPYRTHTVVAVPDKAALMAVTDPYFRGFDLKFPDYWRFTEWNREFQHYVATKTLPRLELVRIMRDHLGDFGGAMDGTGTVKAEMGDDDYALGRIVQAVAHSPYAASTVVISVEDDAQNGPDHVSAHRSVALVAGAYVRQGAAVSAHYDSVSVLRTIEDLLGMKPMGINDAVAEPMAAVFATTYTPWSYTATVPPVLYTTRLPVGPPPAGLNRGAAGARRSAAYWAAQTRGMDFSTEDKVNAAKFNRILWRGLEGASVPYPIHRSGRDLRKSTAAGGPATSDLRRPPRRS